LLSAFSEGAKLFDPTFEFVPKFERVDYDEKCSLVAPLNQRRTDRLASPVNPVVGYIACI
jgi:hypothetical protein